MGKPTKTTNEVTMREWGAQQVVLRRMSPETRDRYSLAGTPGYDRHVDRKKAAQERAALRQRLTDEFNRDEPRFGSYRGMTPEEAASACEAHSRAGQAWAAKRIAFRKDLDTRYPKIFY